MRTAVLIAAISIHIGSVASFSPSLTTTRVSRTFLRSNEDEAVPEKVPKAKPKAAPKEKSEVTSKAASGDAPKKPPKATPKAAPKETPEVTSEGASEDAPEASQEVEQKEAPEAKPEVETVNAVVGAPLDEIGGSTLPLKNWDPLNLAEVGEMETLRWFRAAELKHSRVAMLAVTGYVVQASGFHFPGMLSSDVSFESLSKMNPFDSWDAVPDAGKAQIIAGCFAAELASESKGTHYTNGGPLPEVVFPKFDFSQVNPDTLATKRKRELNNGRLAMIAIISFICAREIPGSVPALEDIEIFTI